MLSRKDPFSSHAAVAVEIHSRPWSRDQIDNQQEQSAKSVNKYREKQFEEAPTEFNASG
jgi:hypothetical protein